MDTGYVDLSDGAWGVQATFGSNQKHHHGSDILNIPVFCPQICPNVDVKKCLVMGLFMKHMFDDLILEMYDSCITLRKLYSAMDI